MEFFMTEYERDQILLKLDKKFNQFDTIQEKVNQIDAMQNDIKELKEETRKISKSVAVIEQERGDKIQMLIDISVGYLEKKNILKKI